MRRKLALLVLLAVGGLAIAGAVYALQPAKRTNVPRIELRTDGAGNTAAEEAETRGRTDAGGQDESQGPTPVDPASEVERDEANDLDDDSQEPTPGDPDSEVDRDEASDVDDDAAADLDD